MRYLDLIKGNLAAVGSKTAVVGNNRRFTFSELDARIDQLGSTLQGLGCNPGDHVAILAANEVEYLEVQAACLRFGFGLVPLNVRLTGPELEFIVGDSRPAAIVAGRDHSATAVSVAHATHGPPVLALGEQAPQGAILYEKALAEAPPPLEPPTDPSLTATILYTSGTTGRPKGAMIDRVGFTARVLINSVELGARRDDVHLAALPMFHIAAFLTYAHVANGGTLVMLEDFSPTALFDVVERERVTTTCLVPTIIRMVTDAPDRGAFDLSSLRLIIYGGSSIEPGPLRAAIEAFGCEFHQQFGMTETGGQTILRPADHRPEDHEALSSAGSEAVGVQVRIVDEEDRDVPPGEKGEIICRAPSLMVRYLNRPDATEEAFRGGWFHTGDIGYRDSRGYLHIADRRNDMIITGGENVYPREVEAVLVEHPLVVDVAVIGIPDELWGERVTAVLVRQSSCEEKELDQWARARLAAYKVPRTWVFVDELPRNVTGKVLKHTLRAEYGN